MKGNKTPKLPKAPKLKVKTYDPPDKQAKYIVVVDPPGTPTLVQTWLSAMFRDESGAVDAYYHTSSTASLVIRLKSGLKLDGILGMHYWRDFLPQIPVLKERTSVIYEYNYHKVGDPVNQRQFQIESLGVPATNLYNQVWKPYPKPAYATGPPLEGKIRELVLPLPRDLPQPPGSFSKPVVKEDIDFKNEPTQADFEWIQGANLDSKPSQYSLDVKPGLDIKPDLDVKPKIDPDALDSKDVKYFGANNATSNSAVKSENDGPTTEDFNMFGGIDSTDAGPAQVKSEADGPSSDDFIQYGNSTIEQKPSFSSILGGQAGNSTGTAYPGTSIDDSSRKRAPEDTQADQSKRIKSEF